MQEWALILGASSGFGAATARELARRGFHIIEVHLDRRATLHLAEAVQEDIRKAGKTPLFFNVNAADPEKQKEVLDRVEAYFEEHGGKDQHHVRVLLHSLAFGTLLPYVPMKPEDRPISRKQMDMTLEVMAHTLVYWAQDLVMRGLMREGGRIFAMTSSGGHRVMPYYGAVSAAKAALESHIRQLALELAPRGITANAIRAGVTDTPALRKIPGHERFMEIAVERNPHHRLTTPEDVARAIGVLVDRDLYWMTGNVINVDGGEDIVG